jgi:hypothetical protein
LLPNTRTKLGKGARPSLRWIKWRRIPRLEDHNRRLIWIKASVGICATMISRNRRSRPMALDVMLVVCIAAGFGILAATLYWADLQTRGLSK